MFDWFFDMLQNKIILVSLTAWFLAQTIKVVYYLLKEKKLDFRRFVEAGGMPSSHTAFVISMTTAIGKIDGYQSSLFAVALTFSLVVMYDAAGVRRAAGKQAEVLNELLEHFLHNKKMNKPVKLKELLGHTPVEVFFGGILGIIIANLMI
jgi:acid phosphatase family membrane protein YuiD